MKTFRIIYANEPLYMSYVVQAENCEDARVMGEVWGKRWNKDVIEQIIQEK